ncbi:hypothetical protein GGS21DRAFT_491965 [Xylaria nigripes]|nr:hypothetical protein GGS21DRAFT_491965 [Xylaria nigripes]
MKTVDLHALIAALVPKIDLSTAQLVLDSRLDSAAAFGSAYQELQGHEADSMNAKLFMNIALDKSVDSDHVYSFPSTMVRDRLDDAQNSFDKAHREFEELYLTLKERRDKFKEDLKGLEGRAKSDHPRQSHRSHLCRRWQHLPGLRRAFNDSGGHCIDDAEQAFGVWEQIKNTTKAIQKIHASLQSYLKQMQELIVPINQIIDLVKNKSLWIALRTWTFQEGSSSRAIKIHGDDVVNITAKCDEFHSKMINLYDQIKAENIEVAREFFLHITELVIRGKAFFSSAQTALISAGDAYLIVVQRHIAKQSHTHSLRRIIPEIQGSSRNFGIVKLAMAEHRLALRTLTALDFRQYLASYAWNCLDATRPIVLDP